MKRLLVIYAVLGVLLGITDTAHAALVGISTRVVLGGNDYVDWGALGTSYPPDPFSTVSGGGIGLTVSESSASTFLIRVQGSSVPGMVGWGGSFAPGDILLSNTSDHWPGAFTIDFDTPISGAGAQINAFDWTPFDATIEAFNSGGSSLGIITFNNLENGWGANAAPFIGVQSDSSNIVKIIISSDEARVINQLDLAGNGGVILDSDEDGIPDTQDNCLYTPNSGQEDTCPPQGNGIGDACDCEGDFNCDSNVDATDVDSFLADFGRSAFFNPCTNQDSCNGDFKCDGNVDADDLTKFLGDFGRSQFFNLCPDCVVGNWCVY